MSAASRRRHIDISSHLTSDELALLAEGKAGDTAVRLREHLAHCQNCFQAYQDAVEFRARALTGQEPHAPPELVKNGRNVPFRRSRGKGVTRPRSGHVILVSASALVGLAALWIFLGPGGSPKSSLSSEEMAVLRDLAAQASEQGLMFPEASDGKQEPLYRTGEVGSSPEVQRIIEQLKALSKEAKASSDDLFWLVSAELATNDLDMARLHLERANVDSDVRLLKLRAILAYRESRLTDAEQDLHKVLVDNSRDDEAKFNLGFLLAESGKMSQGMALLHQVSESKNAEIKKRADQALDTLSAP